jgi:hypothetical protein
MRENLQSSDSLNSEQSCQESSSVSSNVMNIARLSNLCLIHRYVRDDIDDAENVLSGGVELRHGSDTSPILQRGTEGCAIFSSVFHRHILSC